MKKVFISYSSKDKDFVKRLSTDLESHGIKVWVDFLTLGAGDSFANIISDAIKQSDLIIIVLSPNYIKSKWAESELQLSIFRETEESKIIVLPIIIKDCDIPFYLRSKMYADFRTDYQKGINVLIKSILPEKNNFSIGIDFGTSATCSIPHIDEEKEPEGIVGERIKEKSTNEIAELKSMLQEAVELFRKNTGPPINLNERLIFKKSDIEIQKNHCFVIMPFNDHKLAIVYEDFIKPCLEEEDFKCVRGDDIFGSNIIIEDIWENLNKAELVIAELTGRNANVFYEVGISHAIGKNALLLSQSIDDVPFDLRHRRVLLYEYSPRGCKKLENDLRSHLHQIKSK